LCFSSNKVYQQIKKKEEVAPKAPNNEEVLLSEIRDLLKRDNIKQKKSSILKCCFFFILFISD